MQGKNEVSVTEELSSLPALVKDGGGFSKTISLSLVIEREDEGRNVGNNRIGREGTEPIQLTIF